MNKFLSRKSCLFNWSTPENRFSDSLRFPSVALLVRLMLIGMMAQAMTQASPIITGPTNGAVLSSVNFIAGTNTEGLNLLTNVTVGLRQAAHSSVPDLWWSGTAWQTNYVSLPATLTPTNWIWLASTNPPLSCGLSYAASVITKNNQGISSGATNSFTADPSPPVVIFTSHADDQVITSLDLISGTISDESSPSNYVALSLREYTNGGVPGDWWNGASFQSSPAYLPCVVDANGHWTSAPGVSFPCLVPGETLELMAIGWDLTHCTNSTAIQIHSAAMDLTWDDGTQPHGVNAFTNTCSRGGQHYFRLVMQNPNLGAVRIALDVFSGEANLYVAQGYRPTTSSYFYRSILSGDDGVVLHSSQVSAGQEWYVMVDAQPGASWSLLAGDIFVHDLGELASDASSGTNVSILPEGIAFFRTTVPADTLAWRLWVSGATNTIYVKKSLAAHPASYDLLQDRAMLVVPPYLNSETFNGSYFVAVPGEPNSLVHLDSRKHSVTDLAFNSAPPAINVSTSDFPYLTYRVQVPVQQIAWQINLFPQTNNADLSVSRDRVPNEFRNDGLSEALGMAGDSVTFVPTASGPGLTDGTYFITVYGTGAFSAALTNGNPTITDVNYSFITTNDAPNRAGWRFYRASDITNQLGSLGWELTLLSNSPPGTEIALRRNAVPGRWQYRQTDSYRSTPNVAGYVDYSSTLGFLQRPGHQADIWYIGIYHPSNVLGSFVLQGKEIAAAPLTFDGGTTNRSNQPAGRWEFSKIIVPTNDSPILGWDVRLRNVTGGAPYLVVRRDSLPADLTTTAPNQPPYWDTNGTYSPWPSRDWPSGFQWTPSGDWTGAYSDPDGHSASPHTLTVGMGNPLQPGTYYLGVYNSATGTNTTSYTLLSRAIGTNGESTTVRDLGFVASTNIVALPPRETAFFRVAVPSNAPSWKLKLTATNGEALMLVHKGWIPNTGAQSDPNATLYAFDYSNNQYQASRPTGGVKRQKSGNEHLTVLPSYGFYETNLPPGDYFVAIVSEGVNPTSGRIGSNTVNCTLSSFGTAPVTDLGLLGAADLVATNAQEYGELKEYRFTVPPGTLSVEVRLTNRLGNPLMSLKQTANLVRGTWAEMSCGTYYGDVNGESPAWFDESLITLGAPTPGNYTLAISTGCNPADATNVITVHAVKPYPVNFDGGSTNISEQAASEWRYFEVIIPTNTTALGWDVRLRNVNGGSPSMVVRRDLFPGSLATSYPASPDYYYWDTNFAYYPWLSRDWRSGYQWAAVGDWTGDYYDEHGNSASPQTLTMGMGNPMQPGTYYVGVYNGATGTNTTSYSLVSRAIGTNGESIVVRDLNFVGSTNIMALPPRETAFFHVAVPSNTPSWKLKLTPTIGEALVLVQKGWIPNSGAQSDPYGILYDFDQNQPVRPTGGLKRQKDGNEHLSVLPRFGYETNLPPGDYFIAVVSEGVNPGGGRIGSNSVNCTLSSFGSVPTNYLGIVGATDLLMTNAQEFGEYSLYQFTVPDGVSSMEVRLENRVGNPWMNLKQTAQLVIGHWLEYSCGSYEGDVNGDSYQTLSDGNLITVAAPVPGTYTLAVATHRNPASGCAASDVAYTVRVHAVAPVRVDFDGGSANLVAQPASEWRYFEVIVPTNTAALGWDVRLRDLSGGAPCLVVRRDLLPGDLSDSRNYPTYWGGQSATNWPSGFQWVPSGDWTGYFSDASGNAVYPQTLTVGMGNPLQPGTYYVGVYNSATGTNSTSYTLVSHAIGSNGESIVVRDLSFTGSTNITGLAPRETAFFRVNVPSNTPGWKIKLATTTGDALLLAHKGWIPNSGALPDYLGTVYSYQYGAQAGPRPTGGRKQQKPGNEHLAVLPISGYETNLPAGEYFIAVVSEGVNPNNGRIGSNTVSFTLSSGPVPTNILGVVGLSDLIATNSQEYGEYKLYQFTVADTNVSSLEVRLENRTGNPWMSLKRTSGFVSGNWQEPNCGGYSGDVNGESATWSGDALITLVAPNPGTYVLCVATHPTSYSPFPGCQPADANYTVRVHAPEIPDLSFDRAFNTNGFTNALSGVLADNQRTYFRVEVPDSVSNAPVLGWKLNLIQNSGTPSIRVRPGALPDDANSTAATPFAPGSATIAPPYLTAGTWFVEVKGSGSTDFTLVSSAITTNTLERPLWRMPAIGEATATLGLSLPEFGDTGTGTNGVALPGDRGVDLEQGRFHYYGIIVPTNNAGLIRTELQAISGNPNLYLRAGAAPTLSHFTLGQSGSTVYDRSLTGSQNTEYGNWVPLNGRTETRLAPGVWVLAVHAAGNSNIRYRLKLSCGNPVNGGLVQDLNLDGTTLINQNLAGLDWRYYRFVVPTNPPAHYTLNFARTLGGARLFVRDTTPPGDPETTYAQDYYNAGFHFERDWFSDHKNQGPYPLFDSPGAYTLDTPPLRPGHSYYFGVWSPDDTTFSLGLATNNSVFAITNILAFYGGAVTSVLPANSRILYRVDVPADGTRWKLFATNSAEVVFTIEQGTLPQAAGGAHWRSSGADVSLSQPLDSNSWPWQPAQSYYLLITNTSVSSQNYTLRMDGRSALTDDEDGDGLPDAWEIQYFGNANYYSGNSDPDGDGVSNWNEFLNGSNPTVRDPFSFAQTLDISGGQFQFRFVGPTNGRYRIDYRTNLALGAWIPWFTFTNSGGATWISDSNSPFNNQRFYRAVAQ